MMTLAQARKTAAYVEATGGILEVDERRLTKRIAATIQSVDGSVGSGVVALLVAQALDASVVLDVVPPPGSALACTATHDQGLDHGWSVGTWHDRAIHARRHHSATPPPLDTAPSTVVVHQGSVSVGFWEHDARAAAPKVYVAPATLRGLERIHELPRHRALTVVADTGGKVPRAVRKAVRGNPAAVLVRLKVTDPRDLTPSLSVKNVRLLTKYLGVL